MNKPPEEGMTRVEQLIMEFIRFGIDHPYQYEIMFMIRDEELLAYCRAEQGRCFDLFSSIVRRHMKEEGYVSEDWQNVPLTMFLSAHGFISYYIQDKVSFDDVKEALLAHIKVLCRSL